MTTEQPLVFVLGRGHNGFYCPESNFHLIGELRPRQVYPHKELTDAVRAGVRYGILIDINGVLKPEDITVRKGADTYNTSEDLREQIRGTEVVEAKEEQTTEDITKSIVMSEEDIDDATNKVLLAFIENNEDLTLEGLGLSTKPRVEEVRTALKAHYGYIKTEE